MKYNKTEVVRSTDSQATPSADGCTSSEGDEQKIRERAYAIHEAHDDPQRSPELDWLEAEQQIKTARSRPRTARGV